MTDRPLGTASLLERETALSAVRDALDAVAAGGAGVLFVVGPAGIGKTSVLAAARGMAAEAGFGVVTGVGTPMEAGLPYGLIGQAAVALGGSAVDDVAELARLGGQAARLYRTFRFFVEAAADRPLLLALDDLHWADADSLELLGFMCRRIAGAPILVMGALRPEPDLATRLVEELVGSDYARMVALEPLSRGAAAALLGEGLEEAERERVLDSCAGSPLLLTVAASAPRGGASLAGVPADAGFGRSLLLERFVGLGQEAFRYIRAASVFGVRFRPALAGTLAGMDERVWPEAHVGLVRAGLLEDLGGGWSAFVHPLFAQAVFEGLPASERERAHARAFRLLVERGEPDAVAVGHAIAARLTGDPLAIDVAARAGREALAQGAAEAARGHLASAVELAGPKPAPGLLLDYVAALSARGEAQEAQTVCHGLLLRPDLDDRGRGQALTLLARTAVVIGEPVRAERLYEQAAAAVGAEVEARVSILADAAFTCHITSSIPWVLGVAGEALELIPEGTPTWRSLRMLEAYSRLMSADTSGVDLLVSECRQWLDTTRSGDHSWAWTLAVYALNSFKLFEDFSGATEVFEREFPRAVEDGSPIMINALAIAYADFVHRTGRPQEALDLVQTANGVSDMHMAPWYEVAMSVLLTELGRDEEAESHLAVLRAVSSAVPPEYYAPVSLWLDLLEARQLLALGEPEAASDAMLHAAEVASRSGWRHPVIVPWADFAVEAHLAARRPQRARAVLDDLERVSAPLSARWPQAAIALGRAGLAAAAGRLEEADAGFLEALRAFDELPLPIARAEALVGYGKHLRRTGRPREARRPLRQALALAERIGSERVARLARAELAASGGRRRRDDGLLLTAREERVAELAAQGMSNAQIAAALTVSPKTIDNHLQQVYAKLSIHSRRELMRRGSHSSP